LSQKKSYSRYFIILQEEEKGYALASDKDPTGYVKLEIKNDKCKISFYVQNLKKEKEPYHMALICFKKETKNIISLGLLNIDEQGRAEHSFEFPDVNIMNTGIDLDKVIGASVIKSDDKRITSVMSGFMITEIPEWKMLPIIPDPFNNNESKEELEEIETIETPTESTPEVNFSEYEDMIDKIKEDEFKEVEPQVEPQVEPEVEPAEEYKIEEEETEEEREDKEVNQEQKVEKEEYIENINLEETRKDEGMPIGSSGEFFKEIMIEFNELATISREIKNCRWFKVPINKFEELSDVTNYNKYTVVYYPMLSYYRYIKNHKHFIMGLKYSNEGKMKYLVYGVPGTKSILDQPFGGKSGFVTWIPCSDESLVDGFGYWLMFYDFRTSTVVIPFR
jgi:hypothetical protein